MLTRTQKDEAAGIDTFFKIKFKDDSSKTLDPIKFSGTIKADGFLEFYLFGEVKNFTEQPYIHVSINNLLSIVLFLFSITFSSLSSILKYLSIAENRC